MYYIHVEFSDTDGAPRRNGLRDFGFDDDFMRDYLTIAAPDELPARVVEVQRGLYGLVLNGDQGVASVDATVSGRLLHEAASGSPLPAVGDWVVVRRDEGPGGAASIRAVLPRRSAFVRRDPGDKEERIEAQVLAANVDTAFIVAAADQRWSARRIERYVTLACEAGVEPVIVITKADMAADGEALLREAESLIPGAAHRVTGSAAWTGDGAAPAARSAVLVCAPEGRGLEGLEPWLRPGRTVVLLGSSGAGKSTLLNALAGTTLAATQAVRSDDDRGRHTTTHRQLYRLPSGALVIDSPGLREIQVLAGEEALATAFSDVEEIALRCRFRDCRHEKEPGCAVREALETGELDEGRYAGWKKLRREVAFLAAREDPNEARAQENRWKVINKSMRGYSKERRSIQGRAR
jgi:ribosome biogenesis GTPase